MAEGQRAALVLRLLLAQCGLRNLHTADDDVRDGEDGHTDEQQGRYVGHAGVLGHSAHEQTRQQRGQRSGERVHGTTNLDELVTTVTTTTQNVEHGVHHGVEHTDAETADEGTQQVNQQVEGNGNVVVGEYIGSSSGDARQVLKCESHNTHDKGDEGGLLITIFNKHLTSRDAHEQIGSKVHQVTPRLGKGIGEAPDVAKRGTHIGDERNHRKDKAHRDDGYYLGVVFLL